MISIDVKSNVDFDVQGALKKSIKAFAMQIAKESEPYVRWQSGTTARSVTRSDFENGHITYDTPYAKATYFNVNSKVTKEVHPLACAKWVDVAFNSKKERLIDFLKDRLIEGMKK